MDQRLLHDVFGIRALRPGQREVIENVLRRRDTLAIMPTGAGKSLCYQLPALEMQGLTVVVSPLISLMKDQADKLAERGVEAAALNSTLSQGEQKEALCEIRRQLAEFVFTTPERLTDAQFIATLKKTPIDLVVVDEAHCISQWGHDFRPAFLEIANALRALGDPPVLALTATAPPQVAEDIVRQLGRPQMEILNAGVYRRNLRYAVRQVTSEEEKRAALLSLVRATPGCGIVYAATVKAAEEIHARLQSAGESVLLYHGRVPARQRAERQEAFMRGEARVMVATNAFGMGIDKRDIRFVIHYQMPGSLEAYYQESGRAGRDGKESHCTLLYDHADRRVQLFFIGGSKAGKREDDRRKLEQMTQYAQSARCRWQLILEYFAEAAEEAETPCGRCDNCLRPPEDQTVSLPDWKPEPQPRALQPGDRVEVPKYGRGVVDALADDRVSIAFPNGQTKSFAPDYVVRAS